jgi:hypothetical protein
MDDRGTFNHRLPRISLVNANAALNEAMIPSC